MSRFSFIRLVFCYLVLLVGLSSIAPAGSISRNDRILKRAFQRHQSEFQVTFTGKVIALLADDQEGDRHQRFIVELESGQTLLVVHNIDIAPRVRELRKGAKVKARGEYIWNSQGGLVHFTHHALYDDHPGGWLKFRGQKYR